MSSGRPKMLVRVKNRFATSGISRTAPKIGNRAAISSRLPRSSEVVRGLGMVDGEHPAHFGDYFAVGVGLGDEAVSLQLHCKLAVILLTARRQYNDRCILDRRMRADSFQHFEATLLGQHD